MKNHIDALKQKANECIDRAVVESEKICANNIRCLINAEFNFGKFNAYVDILKEVDFDSYIQLVECNKLKCNEILCNIENIYQ